MKTLKENLGHEKAKVAINKRIQTLAEWAKSKGMHFGICLIDAGGKVIPDHDKDIYAVVLGPHAMGGLETGLWLVDRAVKNVPQAEVAWVMQEIRKEIDRIEKEYGEPRSETKAATSGEETQR
jgi:hypothetical protein